MEETVFHLPAVAGVLREEYVEARLHTDGDAEKDPVYDRIRELQQELAGSKANPVYLILDPASREPLGRFDGADITGKRFEAFLRKALEQGPR